MKRIILTLITAILLTSCSNDNENNNKELFLKNYTQYSKSSENNTIPPVKTRSYNYIYDGNKIQSLTIEYDFYDTKHKYEKRKYTYTGDLITKIENIYGSSDSDVVSLTTTTIIYENNKLKSTFAFEEETGYGSKNVYTYNSNGTITKDEFAIFSEKEYLTSSAVISLDSKENVVKFDSYSYSLSISYDNKNNPLKNILGYSKLLIDRLFIAERISNSRNNIIKTVDFDKSAQTNYQNSNSIYENTYNSDNYPIKSVVNNTIFEYTYY